MTRLSRLRPRSSRPNGSAAVGPRRAKSFEISVGLPSGSIGASRAASASTPTIPRPATGSHARLTDRRGGPPHGPPSSSSERGYAPLGLPRPTLGAPRATRGAPRSRPPPPAPPPRVDAPAETLGRPVPHHAHCPHARPRASP